MSNAAYVFCSSALLLIVFLVLYGAAETCQQRQSWPNMARTTFAIVSKGCEGIIFFLMMLLAATICMMVR